MYPAGLEMRLHAIRYLHCPFFAAGKASEYG